MPSGDRLTGLKGPLVAVLVREALIGGRAAKAHRRFYTLAEARELHARLGQAIAALEAGLRLDAERPRAASDPYPFRDHRTQAEIMAQEEAGE